MENSIKYPSIPQTAFWISEGKAEFFELEGLPVEFWRHVAVRGGGGGARTDDTMMTMEAGYKNKTNGSLHIKLQRP